MIMSSSSSIDDLHSVGSTVSLITCKTSSLVKPATSFKTKSVSLVSTLSMLLKVLIEKIFLITPSWW